MTETKHVDPHVLNVGSRYEVLETLEGGPSQSLLRVFDRLRGEELALRAVPSSRLTERNLSDFRAEFLKLSAIDHPYLARPVDLGRSEGAIFYTRELAPGKPVTEVHWADQERALVDCLTGIVDALAALHDVGQIHGLVLPGHLPTMITEGRLGSIRLADAGLRQLLPTDQVTSWRRYEAPEVSEGAEVSPASDLYQLGATLLEALGGPRALALLHQGSPKPFRSRFGELDRHLLDFLDLLVSPDPRRRPASGLEALRALRASDWALPDRSSAVELFISPLLVGREAALGELGLKLRQAAKGEAETHAAEIVGESGTGRSRLLAEVGAHAASDGWVVVPIEPRITADALEVIAAQVELALGIPDLSRAGHREGLPCSAKELERPLVLVENGGAEAACFARFAAVVGSALQRSGANLLLLADNADRFPAGLRGALRYLVTEADGRRRIFVLATGTKPVGLPDSAVVEIGPLAERDLRRLLAPLLTESLDPDPALAALKQASGGNPLWVRLLLSSWIESGRLRLVEGRPYFDEAVPAEIPATIDEAVRALVGKLTPPEREVVEAMAVWGRPLSAALAAKLVPVPLPVPQTLIIADSSETLRFTSDAFGPLILEALPPDRLQSWHRRILVALEEEGVEPGLRAFHLLGSGRTAEAVRDFIAGARQAAGALSLHTALDYYNLALANLGALNPGEIDRGALALEAARVAIRIGEYGWAGEALGRVDLPAGEAMPEARLHLDLLLARAHVLREKDKWVEAAQLYANARALAQRVPALKGQELLVDLEEAKNDFLSGEWRAGKERLTPVVPRLEKEGSPALFAAALNRMATLVSQSGDVKGAALLALRAARLARSLGDHLLAAMAFCNVGSFYQRLGKASRALKALERCRRHLAVCPHDGIKGAELLHRGNVLLSLGRLEEADKALVLARAVRLRNAERRGLAPCLIQLGRIRRHMGHLEEAISFYSEALEVAESLHLPEAHLARANLGELCLYQGEYHQAERLLRHSLPDDRPHYRALNLKNLGVLLRKLGRLREAQAVLSEAEEIFAQHLPQQRPLAAIELARVALEAGDVEGALLRLEGMPHATESADLEVRAFYYLARGLCLARGNEDPYGALDLAAEAVLELNDSTLRAEVLADSLAAVLELQSPEAAWVRHGLGSLAEAASQTDARPAVQALELMRERVAARFPTSAPSAQLAEDLASTVLSRAEGSVDLMLRHLIDELQGARGAVAVAIAVGPDGTLGVTPVPRAPKAEVDVVRPYRVAARDFDRQVFRQALAATKGNVPRAARLLRLPESTFRYRAGRLGLLRREKRGSSP